MIINHNISALNTYRQLGVNNNAGSKSMEKLSSGLRINRAGDDAAGLAISEKMRGQIKGLNQASRNAQDSISLIQTAEGALSETHNILQRMRELAVQSSNDTNTETDRGEIQKEINQLADEIDRIRNTTEFNTQKLLNGEKVGIVKAEDGKVSLENNSTADLTNLNVTLADTDKASELTKDLTITVTRVNESTTFDAADFVVSGPNSGIAEADLKALFSFGDGTDQATLTLGTANGFNSADDNVINIGAAGALADMKATESFTINIKAAVEAKSDVSNALTMQIGANTAQTISIGINDMSASELGVRNGSNGIDVSDARKATSAITSVNNAIEKVSAERSNLGAIQNRLEHTISNLDNSAENLQAAESRVRDVDMAKEVMEMTRANILGQASQAMLAQANQKPQSVLQLLG